jgi:hypothetical protein
MPGPAVTESRRQSPRLKAAGRLQTRIVTLPFAVEILDVSFGGFLVGSPVDIPTGDIHVFEVMTPACRTYTLRARAVHCQGSHGGGPRYLSGWRCATDETTQAGLNGIIASLIGSPDAGVEPVVPREPRKMATVWQLLMTVSTGAEAGRAVVCPEVRYAAIRWHLAPQIDRRLGSSAMWRPVTGELTGAPVGSVLGHDSVTSALLLPEALRTVCTLQIENRPSIPTTTRDALTEALDCHLWYLDEFEFVHDLLHTP